MEKVPANILKGLIRLREKGYYIQCIEAVTQRLATDTNIKPGLRRSLWALRADCYLDTEQWHKAIDDLTRLLDEKPGSDAAELRGLALWYLGKLDDAFTDFKKAIRYDPSNAVAYRNLGDLQIQRGKIRSGFMYIRRAIKLVPQDAIGYVFLGDAFMKTDKIVLAVEAYITALRLDPNNARAKDQIQKIEEDYLEEN